jgi:hypothetical protein
MLGRMLAHENRRPSPKAVARRLTLSIALQRYGLLCWLLLCVMFWIGVARLVF